MFPLRLAFRCNKVHQENGGSYVPGQIASDKIG